MPLAVVDRLKAADRAELSPSRSAVVVHQPFEPAVFDQHIDPSLHQLLRGTEVMDRGYRDRCRLNCTVRGGELLDRSKAGAAKFARHRVRSRPVRINHSHQPYRRAFLGELTVNTSVVAAESAYANHSDVNNVSGCQVVSSQFEKTLSI